MSNLLHCISTATIPTLHTKPTGIVRRIIKMRPGIAISPCHWIYARVFHWGDKSLA